MNDSSMGRNWPIISDTIYVLVTNLLDTPAEVVSGLYKERWGIELFFKWIKQNLRIKNFLGKSENAVNTQIAIALILYLLISLFNLHKKSILFYSLVAHLD